MKSPCCPNPACSHGDVVRHGFYKTKSGRRRRYRCTRCRRTFCSTRGTPYYRLQHRRSSFDEVAALSVEGVSKSSISRLKGLAWNTVDRWLERAASCCRRFNDQTITDVDMQELQADEIRTIAGGKDEPSWIFSTIDVWSRLWPSTAVGCRSYRNTRELLRDTARRMRRDRIPLIVTDGYEFYERVVREVFGPACLYGQVVKTRRNDRVVKIERMPVIGAKWRFDEALSESEDSSTLNTAFIERLNLTIRQGCAYLTRRTTCHARRIRQLENQIEIVRCHYNFLRPHRALKFGPGMRTPAMQAGLARRRLTFRDIFLARATSLSAMTIAPVFIDSAGVRRVAA